MNRGNIWSSLLCFAALGLIVEGCAGVALLTGQLEPPVIKLTASKVTSFSSHGAGLLFHFEVRNPNRFSLAAHDLDYRLKIGNTVIAQGNWQPVLTLPANDAVQIGLPVHIDVDKLLQAAATALALGEIPYQIEASLTVGSLLFERQIDIVESSVLLLNLPLGLAGRDAASRPLS